MKGTPECPGCGAKFQHSTEKAECKVCGLPDEVIAAGPQAVGRWMKQEARRRRKRGLEVPWAGQRRGASLSRRRKPHGRAGAVATVYPRYPAAVANPVSPPTVSGTILSKEI